MKKTLVLSFVLFSLVFISCSSEKTPPQQGTSAPGVVEGSVKPITVKGFSLGMDFSKARENAIKLFEGVGFSKEISTEISQDKTEITVWETPDNPNTITIFKDKANKLDKVEMSSYAVNTFFKATSIEAADFVKEFSKNFGLPEMSETKDELVGYTYWKYESKTGWYVRINDAKYLIFGSGQEKAKPVFN